MVKQESRVIRSILRSEAYRSRIDFLGLKPSVTPTAPRRQLAIVLDPDFQRKTSAQGSPKVAVGVDKRAVVAARKLQVDRVALAAAKGDAEIPCGNDEFVGVEQGDLARHDI
jgi:hypothetical protein